MDTIVYFLAGGAYEFIEFVDGVARYDKYQTRRYILIVVNMYRQGGVTPVPTYENYLYIYRPTGGSSLYRQAVIHCFRHRLVHVYRLAVAPLSERAVVPLFSTDDSYQRTRHAVCDAVGAGGGICTSVWKGGISVIPTSGVPSIPTGGSALCPEKGAIKCTLSDKGALL